MTMKTLKEAVSTLLKQGAKRVDNLVVNNITVKEFENYTRLALTLNKNVEGYIANEDGTYEKGETNVVFVSLYSVTAVLRENDEAAFAVNTILENPGSVQVILSRAKITLLQEQITAGEVRTNPFTGEQDEDVLDHDTIFNHVVSIDLSDIGRRGLDKMFDKLLGI